MERKARQPEDEGGGAPEWMVTFSDCMTLLLTFFVLLLSFSSFDERVFRNLRVIFCDAMSGISGDRQAPTEAFLPPEGQVMSLVDLADGSEKPTLQTGKKDTLQETEPEDFYSRKVFLFPSEQIFWGRSTVISSEGREIMATMASFLRRVPSRIVISENAPGEKADRRFGLERSWAVMNYLAKRRGLKRGWFSISAASTISGGGKSGGPGLSRKAERVVEIVLLERSLYN